MVITVNFKTKLEKKIRSKYLVSYVPLKYIKIKNSLLFDLKFKKLLSFPKRKTKKINFDSLENILISSFEDYRNFFKFLLSFSIYKYDYFVYKRKVRNFFIFDYLDIKTFYRNLIIFSLKSLITFLEILDKKKNKLTNFEYILISFFTFGYILYLWFIDEIGKNSNQKLALLYLKDLENIKKYEISIDSILDQKLELYLHFTIPFSLIFSPLLYYIQIKNQSGLFDKAMEIFKDEKEKILGSINIILNILNTSEVKHVIANSIKNLSS